MKQSNNSIQDTIRMLVDKGESIDEAIDEACNRLSPLLKKEISDQLKESILYEVRK